MKRSKLIILFVLCMLILAGCSKNLPSGCIHEESRWIIDNEATCSNMGKKHIECIKCHETLKEEKIEKTAHSLIHHEGKDATCTESGYKEYDTCEDCDYTTFTEIKMKSHVLIHHAGKNATCTESGYKPYDICENCSYTTYEAIKPLGHDIIHHEGKEATETSSGYKPYDICSRCDYTTYEEIFYQKHNFVNYVCTECFESSPENLKYELMEDESGYYVVGLYNPHSQIKKIVIPNEYNGKPVVGVNFDSFYNCTNLNYVELSDNALYITGYLGNSIFYNEYDNGYYLGSSSNPYMVLVTTKNKDIESIKVNKDTKMIYDYALSECIKLIKITFEENIQLISIGYCAFDGCSSLTSISIPSNVKSIGYCALRGCNNLSTLEIPFLGKSANSDDDYFGYFFGASSYRNQYEYIPSTLYCVVINSDITTISSYAFYNCNNIGFINLLTTYLQYIGSYAFYGCHSLKRINIPYYVSRIDEYAFYQCPNLSIYCECYKKPSGWDKNWKGNNTSVIWNVINALTFNQDGVTYNLINNGAVVLYFDNSVSSLNIPSEIIFDNIAYKVIGIYENAFANCNNLESITIPETIGVISEYAFGGCEYLKIYCEVNEKPNTWSDLWKDEYTPVYWGVKQENIIEQDEMRFLIINDAAILTQYIGDSISVSIPSKIIVNNKYYDVTKIGDAAFAFCVTLKIIEIPDNIESFGLGSFACCSNLNQINIPSEITSIPALSFINCSNLLTLEISENINEIGYAAFAYCEKLEVVDIPSSVEKIEYGAFAYCDNIKQITLPFIGSSLNDKDNAYLGYIFGAEEFKLNLKYIPKNLSTVTIENTNNIIKQNAFYSCSNIDLYILDSFNSVETNAFYNCENINLYFNGTMFDWCMIDFVNEYSNPLNGSGSLYLIDENQNYNKVTDLVIPREVEQIKKYQFYGFLCSSVKMYSTLNKISEYAFANCDYIEHVYYNGTIEDWCNITFMSRESNPMTFANKIFIYDNIILEYVELSNLIIPDSISVIGDYQFSNFNSVTDLTISKSVKRIKIYSFENCKNLKNVYYTGDVNDWCKISFDTLISNPMYYGKNIYMLENNQYHILDVVNITSNILEIGKYQFAGFDNINSVTLPSSVKHIEQSAFLKCYNMQTISLPNTINSIGKTAFSGCSHLSNITLPSNLYSIGSFAFSNCTSLKNITIPRSVLQVDEYVFYGCSNLTIVCENNNIPSSWSSNWNKCM